MMAVLVDSNVIIDVATEDPTWATWSSEALARAAVESILVINPIVFAEASVAFDRVEDLDDTLPPELYRREPLPYEAAFLAGKSFLAYRRRGGRRVSPLPTSTSELTRPSPGTGSSRETRRVSAPTSRG
jgi:predicted nucleic acid-binding protein